MSVAYRSKHNYKRKKQVILLMIVDGEKYHYLAIINLFGLLEGNSSNHEGDSYCLNWFNSCKSKNKLKEHEKICNNHNSCCIEMSERINKISKYNPGEKSFKKTICNLSWFRMYIKNIQSIQNNLEKSYTKKKLDMSLLVGQCL